MLRNYSSQYIFITELSKFEDGFVLLVFFGDGVGYFNSIEFPGK